MTCHEDNCPAVCERTSSGYCEGHKNLGHTCSCQGPAFLKELLDAVLLVRGPILPIQVAARLYAAISPFRAHSTIDPVSTISLEPP